MTEDHLKNTPNHQLTDKVVCGVDGTIGVYIVQSNTKALCCNVKEWGTDENSKKATHKRTLASNKGGRPARPMPELIPDAPENIARASMIGPPKKQWQYLRESRQ